MSIFKLLYRIREEFSFRKDFNFEPIMAQVLPAALQLSNRATTTQSLMIIITILTIQHSMYSTFKQLHSAVIFPNYSSCPFCLWFKIFSYFLSKGTNMYRISSYSCLGNYSFLKSYVRQLGNYSREETINFFLLVIHNLNFCCMLIILKWKKKSQFQAN